MPLRVCSIPTYPFSVHKCLCLSGSVCENLEVCNNTTVIGLIQDDDSNRQTEVDCLVYWCGQNNLELNMFKTVEMILENTPHTPLPSTTLCLLWITSGFQEANYLRKRWASHIDTSSEDSVLPAVTQEVWPARGAAGHLLQCHYSFCPVHINHCEVGLSNKQDWARLQRTIRYAERIIRAELLSTQDLHRKGEVKNSADPTHPGHKLFRLLPSGSATEHCLQKQPSQRQFLPSVCL